ncbi:DegV family protein [Pseudalkalibacillus salsuginis]|uniref:DegV family protein n=1 Tax=Pseudalkalibacillus salsuginis TaxID=2910972 RepID=UPI001F2C2779|nr:DegV family protein [Pseudalkalibacillus salsuginis]MCF6410141.1 DegV family protein [Pseudalkalibacillus salsuginis]
MHKVAIITDSTSYLPKNLREQYNIRMVPLNVIFENESYQEETELTADDFYLQVREGGNLPKTSQPAVGLFADLYGELAEEGYTDAIVITLSSEISGTYQSAVSAKTMVDSIHVEVFDSEISCMPQGFFALEAAKMAAQGQAAKVILSRLKVIRAKGIPAYFMVDDLSHLHRGGRLNSAQFFVGNLLQVKPVLQFVDKKIVPFEKIRTRKKAIKRLFELIHENLGKDETAQISVIHANREEEAKGYSEELRRDFPNAEVIITYFGPVIGTHLGEGSIGLTWIKE